MRLYVLRALALLVALWIAALSQPAGAQSMGMDAMLKQTGYTYTTHNATTWSIDGTGAGSSGSRPADELSHRPPYRAAAAS